MTDLPDNPYLTRHVCTCSGDPAYGGPEEDCEVHGELRGFLIQQRERYVVRAVAAEEVGEELAARVAELEEHLQEAGEALAELAPSSLGEQLQEAERRVAELEDERNEALAEAEARRDIEAAARNDIRAAILALREERDQAWRFATYGEAFGDGQEEQRQSPWTVSALPGTGTDSEPPTVRVTYADPRAVEEEAHALDGVLAGVFGASAQGYEPACAEDGEVEDTCDSPDCGQCAPKPDTVTLRTVDGRVVRTFTQGEPAATQPAEPALRVLRFHHDPYGGLTWWEGKPVPAHNPGDLIELVDDGQHQRFRVSRWHENLDGVREWKVVTLGPVHDTPTRYGAVSMEGCRLVPGQAEFRVSGNRFGMSSASAWGYGQLPQPVVLGEFASCPQTNPHEPHQLSQPDRHGWRAWCVGQEHGTLVLAQGDDPPTDLAEAASWLNRHQDDLDRAVRAAQARRHARGWRRLRGWL
jgi:hypothetical protein